MEVVLYNNGYQIIEQFILLQLIQVLTHGLNLINFYEDQKEVGRIHLFHIKEAQFEKHMESLYCLSCFDIENDPFIDICYSHCLIFSA